MAGILTTPISTAPGSVSISIDGLDELRAMPRKYRAAGKREMEIAMKDALIVIYADLIPRLPVDKGTAGGLLGTVQRNQPAKSAGLGGFIPAQLAAVFGAVTGSYSVTGEVISDSPYIATIEAGRRPGAPAPYPLDRLAGWAGRKAGGSWKAYIIARAIALHGIQAKHPFQKTYEATESRVGALFDRAISRAVMQA